MAELNEPSVSGTLENRHGSIQQGSVKANSSEQFGIHDRNILRYVFEPNDDVLSGEN
jgi:hypothetical protein